MKKKKKPRVKKKGKLQVLNVFDTKRIQLEDKMLQRHSVALEKDWHSVSQTSPTQNQLQSSKHKRKKKKVRRKRKFRKI